MATLPEAASMVTGSSFCRSAASWPNILSTSPQSVAVAFWARKDTVHEVPTSCSPSGIRSMTKLSVTRISSPLCLMFLMFSNR